MSVRVEPVRRLARPVTLGEIKAEPRLARMELIRQSRLSVAPVRDEEWRGRAGDGRPLRPQRPRNCSKSLRRKRAARLEPGDDVPDLLVRQRIPPRRHAGHLDPILGDPEQLARLPLVRGVEQIGRARLHPAHPWLARHCGSAVAGHAMRLVQADAAPDLGRAGARRSRRCALRGCGPSGSSFVGDPFGEPGVRLRRADVVNSGLDVSQGAERARRRGRKRGQQQRPYRLPVCHCAPTRSGRNRRGRSSLTAKVAKVGTSTGAAYARAREEGGGTKATSDALHARAARAAHRICAKGNRRLNGRARSAGVTFRLGSKGSMGLSAWLKKGPSTGIRTGIDQHMAEMGCCRKMKSDDWNANSE